jgi:hypothetical protein
MRKPTFEAVGPLTYTTTMARELENTGWMAVRKRGEPVWWLDPMGLVGRMRTGETWMLIQRRKANGIGGA